MNLQMIDQLITEAMSDINLGIVVALMGIGFIIKHGKVKFLENIPNVYIPIILLAFGFIFTILDAIPVITMNTFITAIATSATAIGLHQQGKNIFINIIPRVAELLLGKVDITESEDMDA